MGPPGPVEHVEHSKRSPFCFGLPPRLISQIGSALGGEENELLCQRARSRQSSDDRLSEQRNQTSSFRKPKDQNWTCARRNICRRFDCETFQAISNMIAKAFFPGFWLRTTSKCHVHDCKRSITVSFQCVYRICFLDRNPLHAESWELRLHDDWPWTPSSKMTLEGLVHELT